MGTYPAYQPITLKRYYADLKAIIKCFAQRTW